MNNWFYSISTALFLLHVPQLECCDSIVGVRTLDPSFEIVQESGSWIPYYNLTASQPEPNRTSSNSEIEGWPFIQMKFSHPIQSPVDIINSKAVTQRLPMLEVVECMYPDKQPATFYNSGSTAYVYIKDNPRRRPYVRGGPFKTPFIFEQMHFHWGSEDEWGSEHFLNGESFAVEVHLVHYNSKYSTFEEAAENKDGLAVLAIFAEAEHKYNPLLDPLYKLLPVISSPNTSVTLDSHSALQWATSAISLNRCYFTYPGSLTTRPYSENVVFVVFPRPISLSSSQLNKFRGLRKDRDGNPILDNKRQLQPLHGRPLVKAEGPRHTVLNGASK